MDVMFEICPLCHHAWSESDNDFCSCLRKGRINDLDLVYAHESLVNVARKLMDKGFQVHSCKIEKAPDYSRPAVKIYFREYYDAGFPVGNMPPDWHLESRILSGDDSRRYSVLVDYLQFYDDDEELEHELALTISNLETWVDGLDKEGIRAMLILAGKSVAPGKRRGPKRRQPL